MADSITPLPVNDRVVTREGLVAFTQRLVDQFSPEKVILSGSQVRGDPRQDFDADILVVMPDGMRSVVGTPRRRTECLMAHP